MQFQLQTLYIHAPTVYKLQLNSAEAANQDLLRNKARLEHDLAIKSNSLHIDREGCVATRKTFPVVSSERTVENDGPRKLRIHKFQKKKK